MACASIYGTAATVLRQAVGAALLLRQHTAQHCGGRARPVHQHGLRLDIRHGRGHPGLRLRQSLGRRPLR